MADISNLERVLKNIATYDEMRDSLQRKGVVSSIAAISMVTLTRVGEVKTEGNTFVEHIEQYIGFVVFFGPLIFCLMAISFYISHLRLETFRESIVKSITLLRLDLLPSESYRLDGGNAECRGLNRGQAALILCSETYVVTVLALCTGILIVTYLFEMKFTVANVTVGLWRTCLPHSGVDFFGGIRVEWDRALSKNIPWAYPWYPLVYLLCVCVQGMATWEILGLSADRNRRLLRAVFSRVAA